MAPGRSGPGSTSPFPELRCVPRRCSPRPSTSATCRRVPAAPTPTPGPSTRRCGSSSRPSARSTAAGACPSPPAWPRSAPRCWPASGPATGWCCRRTATTRPGCWPRDELERFGIRVDQVATPDVEAVAADGGFDGARLVFLETPSNPLLDVCDIAAVVRAAHAAGALVAVDNTTATPLGQRPLDLGADLTVGSDTKALTGHSDLLLGHVSTRDDALYAGSSGGGTTPATRPARSRRGWATGRWAPRPPAGPAGAERRGGRRGAGRLARRSPASGGRGARATPRSRSPRGRCSGRTGWSPPSSPTRRPWAAAGGRAPVDRGHELRRGAQHRRPAGAVGRRRGSPLGANCLIVSTTWLGLIDNATKDSTPLGNASIEVLSNVEPSKTASTAGFRGAGATSRVTDIIASTSKPQRKIDPLNPRRRIQFVERARRSACRVMPVGRPVEADADRLESPLGLGELLHLVVLEGAWGFAVEAGYDRICTHWIGEAHDQVVLLGPPDPPLASGGFECSAAVGGTTINVRPSFCITVGSTSLPIIMPINRLAKGRISLLAAPRSTTVPRAVSGLFGFMLTA